MRIRRPLPHRQHRNPRIRLPLPPRRQLTPRPSFRTRPQRSKHAQTVTAADGHSASTGKPRPRSEAPTPTGTTGTDTQLRQDTSTSHTTGIHGGLATEDVHSTHPDTGRHQTPAPPAGRSSGEGDLLTARHLTENSPPTSSAAHPQPPRNHTRHDDAPSPQKPPAHKHPARPEAPGEVEAPGGVWRAAEGRGPSPGNGLPGRRGRARGRGGRGQGVVGKVRRRVVRWSAAPSSRVSAIASTVRARQGWRGVPATSWLNAPIAGPQWIR